MYRYKECFAKGSGNFSSSEKKMSGLSLAIHQFSESLGLAIDAKDPYTESHSLEVAIISHTLALGLGLDHQLADIIHIAGHLHDIGKIGVPDVILLKKGPLNRDEWQQIRRHPEIGAAILKPVRDIVVTGIYSMVLHHHESFDGSGYPAGLRGTNIPLGARIITVADSLSAMLSHRPYRPPKKFNESIKEIMGCSGTQFDPNVVEALVAQKNNIHKLLFHLKEVNRLSAA